MTRDFGKGFTVANLKNMRQFYLMFPNSYALRSELSWTDYQNLESAKEFSDKCVEAAASWKPVADRLWMVSRGTACEGCCGCR